MPDLAIGCLRLVRHILEDDRQLFFIAEALSNHIWIKNFNKYVQEFRERGRGVSSQMALERENQFAGCRCSMEMDLVRLIVV